jgi:hypothetical protein
MGHSLDTETSYCLRAFLRFATLFCEWTSSAQSSWSAYCLKVECSTPESEIDEEGNSPESQTEVSNRTFSGKVSPGLRRQTALFAAFMPERGTAF